MILFTWEKSIDDEFRGELLLANWTLENLLESFGVRFAGLISIGRNATICFSTITVVVYPKVKEFTDNSIRAADTELTYNNRDLLALDAAISQIPESMHFIRLLFFWHELVTLAHSIIVDWRSHYDAEDDK